MSELFQVFYEPGKVFDRVRERSMFLPAFLAVIVVACASFALLVNLVGMQSMARKQFEMNPRLVQQIGPDKVEQAVQNADSPARKALGYGAASIGTAIALLIVGGIMLGCLSIAGGKQNFLQVLGATSYAWFPFSILRFVMSAAILLLAPDRENLDFTNLVATNAGAFLDKETTAKPLLALASSLDILTLGQIAFLAFAYSRVSRLSFGKCAALLIGLWALTVIGRVAVAAVTGM